MVKSEEAQEVRFGIYQVTGPQGQLLARHRPLAVSPKAVAVLWTLVQRAGQVVRKEEVFAAVWPETVVSDGVLTNRIRELRQALGDTTTKPRYIETVSRRGYRFIAPLIIPSNVPRIAPTATQDEGGDDEKVALPGPWNLKPETGLVGREAELTHLHRLFAKAARGERQVVFVTGEAGIGKTALVDAFVQSLMSQAQHQKDMQHPTRTTQHAKRVKAQSSALSFPNPQPLTPTPWFAQGQCIEHYGAGEAYLPVLAAVSGLCRQADGALVLSVLRRVAPTWLVQLPALLPESDYAALQQKVAGATRERMLREMAEALEVLSAERPLVLVLEDVHWSDASTIDLLNLLARRREVARVLVIATYRPAEVIINDHPLKPVKHELVTRGYGTEVVLGRLDAKSVQQYVHQRFPDATAEETVAALVYRRTEGHPLFMVQMTEYLTQPGQGNGVAVRAGEGNRALPQQLHDLLVAQLGRLPAQERAILEAASVVGAEFTVASVAAGEAVPDETAETVCEQLVARGQFIVERGLETWADGTVSGGYGFRHVLYQEVLYQGLSASRRARLHRRIGEREEAGYGGRAQEIAAELAMHFEQGRELPRAIHYRYQAGLRALRRYAYQGALTHLQHGLTLLETLPDAPEREQQELLLQLALGSALIAVKGQANPEVSDAYTRAYQLCQRAEDSPQLFATLRGLRRFYAVRAAHRTAEELARRMLALAQRLQNPAFLAEAHNGIGLTTFFLGKLVEARTHLEQAVALHGAQLQDTPSTFSDSEVGQVSLSYAATALWLLGYAEQARLRNQEALVLAHDRADPQSLVLSLTFSARLHQFLRESHLTKEEAEATIRFSTEHGFLFWRASGMNLRGKALAELGQEEEGLEQLQQGLSQLRALGVEAARSFSLSTVAEIYGSIGQPDAGLRELSEALALVEKNGERWWEAELYRLKGELKLQQKSTEHGAKSKERRGKSKQLGVRSKEQSAENPDPPSQFPNSVSEAEACFLKAIEIARQQHAKSLELRAVMSLVRLRQQQASEQRAKGREQGGTNETAGKRGSEEARKSEKRSSLPASQPSRARLAEDHTMLSEVYAWFTEGFDTKDLQEAKLLLEELRQ